MPRRLEFNIFTGEFDWVDVYAGDTPIPVKNLIEEDLLIPAGYTLIHANTDIADGVSVTVEGSLITL